MDAHTQEEVGVVSGVTQQILTVLSQQLSIQVLGDYGVSSRPITGHSRFKKHESKVDPRYMELMVNIFGDPSFFDLVGAFATRCNIYLQHPERCDRNVPYRNPHCLSLEDGRELMTYDLRDPLRVASTAAINVTEYAIDVLLDARQQERLPEAATPSALRTPLYRHQAQALTFMMRRETGWAMDGHHMDIWKQEIDNQGGMVYCNSITGQKQVRPPEQFRGGLLIDAPGLGKSLSIIALVSTDLSRPDISSQPLGHISRTLLIVPKSCKSGIYLLST